MAEPDDKKNEEKPEAQENEERSSGSGILPWIIVAVVVVVCAAAGFGLCRLLAGSDKGETDQSFEQNKGPQAVDAKSGPSGSGSWYYPLEPVATNLNVPGATRYIRAALTLEISSEVQEDDGKKLLKQKEHVLTDLLNIYFKGLSLEDIKNDKDMRRIQYELLDALNEELFPDSKPQIKRILFKEFAIQ